MKKKVLVVSHALELGGAEKSLIGLLDSFDETKYDVDLFLLRHEGELLDQIPRYVNLLPEIPSYTVLARPMSKTIREGHLVLTVARLIGKIAAKIYDKKNHFLDSMVSLEYSHKYTVPFLPKIQKNKEYDLAISFLTPHYFVAQKVKAEKKIAWIHTDYERIDVNVESERKMWMQYDYIASISDSVTENFIKKFPELARKIILLENILPKNLIKKQSEEPLPMDEMPKRGIRLLSIGRYCTAKNFDNVPDICRRLVKNGMDVYWYIIGFGGDEDLIRKQIAKCKMEDRVILLGKKSNPYPYIKACDVYIQPSRYEGKCVSVREAQMFGKPVIITNYSTAKNQLENGVDGVIVPLENEKCAHYIEELLKNPEMLKNLSHNTIGKDYSNGKEIEKVYYLLNDNIEVSNYNELQL